MMERDFDRFLVKSYFIFIYVCWFTPTVLYTFFGARLLYIAWRADPNNTAQKELEEV
jgi:hypothetical protein